MPGRIFRTPLNAAIFRAAFFWATFFCAAVILTGCVDDQTTVQAGYSRCAMPTTAIAAVQGSRPASPLLDQQLTIQGIVTLVHQNEGLYIEEPGSDGDDRTSNAIYVQIADLPAGIQAGAWVSAHGTVTEIRRRRNTLTALTDVSEVTQCSSAQVLPLTTMSLPLTGFEREAFESMRIRLDGALTVTDTYRLNRGGFSLSGNGVQFVATEVIAPGPQTTEHRQRNTNFSLAAMLAKEAPGSTIMATGSVISSITGVLTHDERSLRLSVQEISVEDTPTFSKPEQAASGELRVVGMNLLNFFNGDGLGGEFPTPRGAKTIAAYDDQRRRLGAAIAVLNPQVLAVMELENDGFASLSAAADLIALATEATGGSWQVARPTGDDTGTDAITVGLFYRDDLLEAVGSAWTLTGPEFRKSRQPMAQVFRQPGSDEKILMVVNHLKSKGSCPRSGPDANQKDGQGCWNPMRTAAARKMAAWVNSLSASTQTRNALILGDMNAYRQEDPIVAIRNAGFVELLDKDQGSAYSYIFFGQAGTLDYAFASAALQKKIGQAFIWNINAALPAKMELPQPWLRFSDHDPVVVDIRLHQSPTSD